MRELLNCKQLEEQHTAQSASEIAQHYSQFALKTFIAEAMHSQTEVKLME